MITKKKIAIYKKYNGDVDKWQRHIDIANAEEMEKGWDFTLIESLIQDILLSKSGKAAPEYEIELHKKLNEVCDNKETINQIEDLAVGVINANATPKH